MKLPFIQRFEFIEVSLWLFLIVPNMAIPLWAASRMAKQVFHTSQRITFIGLSILILIMFSLFVGATSFETFNQWVEYTGFFLVYGFIICIVIGLLLKKKVGEKTSMKQYILIGLMLFSLLLTSCAQPRLLDELNISQAAGFDLVEDGEMKGCFVFPVFKSQEQGNYQILSARSNTISNIQFLVSEKSPFPVVMGQVLVILVSEKLAKDVGMIDLMNYIYRDPIIGSRQVFAIVGGEVEDLLYTKMNQTNLNIGVYLSDLLSQNMRNGNQPVTNQHIFMNQMLAKGVDAYLPYIKKTSNTIKVTGVALFDNEKNGGAYPWRRCVYI